MRLPILPGLSTLPDLDGTFRRLWPAEHHLFCDHLLRLDADSRRMRFAYAVSDELIERYALNMAEAGSVTYAYIEDGHVRAAGELKQEATHPVRRAEAAFSVEPAYQGRGIATELMSRLLRSARNRGIEHVVLHCLPENEPMQAVAKKHEAGLRLLADEVTGEITPNGTSYFSLIEEAVDDRTALVMSFMDFQTRLLQQSA